MDNLENEYRRRFQEYDEEPADFVWENIQARIEEKPTRRLAIVWWQYGIAAGILIGLFLSFYLFNKSTQVDTKSVISKVKNQTKPTDNQVIKEKENPAKYRSPRFEISTQSDTDLKFDNIASLKNSQSPRFETSAQTDSNLASDNTTFVKENSSRSSGYETPMQTVSDLKSESINQLQNKSVAELTIEKPINKIPTYESSKAELFEEKEDRKLVFVAPSEVFANITPTLSYYMFSPNTADNFVVSSFQNSKDRLGFAAQVGFTYPIAKKINLRTAFSYFGGKSQVRYTSMAINEPKNVTILNDHSIKVETPQKTQTETYRWQYLEIQSDLLYEIKRNQAVSAGLKAGVRTNDLREPIFNARVGYRYSKPVGNRFALWAEPSLSIMLSKQSSVNNLFIYRTTGLGMNVGVSLIK